MSNEFIKGITEGFIKNLPTILTGTTVVVGLGTVGYSTWAGWKIKEITEDETIDNKTKVKRIAILSTPIVIGATAASGCAIAAQKENSKRFAALAAGAAGAITLTSDETKEKALELIDKNHKIHRAKKKETKANISVNSDEVIEIRDMVTGYKFKTTLSDLWFTANHFNEDMASGLLGTGETRSIAEFYRSLLGDEYDNIPSHELIKFGSDISWEGVYDKNVILSIQLDSELGPDLKPIYTMDYDYLG